jgi:16S rRNA A1518/A1519 N6-dimethyltransferase RsmA/KsgA/DIM1 with predicted DNA glycosylase/AP lyase activity
MPTADIWGRYRAEMSTAEFHEDLVFDIGAHRGEDTEYYLRRGFRVVSVECEPDNVAALRTRFSREITDGRPR